MQAHDDTPNLTTGQRIKLYRERAGKTRAVLGGLVGRSAEWVKAVETGRILPPRLPMLTQIARALKVNVRELTEEDHGHADLVSGPGHAGLPAVREALNRWPMSVSEEPQPLEHIRARLATAWRARHAAPDHRTVVGALLPDLIRDAQVATRAYQGDAQNRAHAVLAETLGLTQMFLAYQSGAADLLWRVVDRAVLAAQESGDPAALAGAVWFAAQAHRDAGDWDTAMAVNLDALTAVEPQLEDADDELLALYGALQFEAAYTAARAGEAGRAWRYWDAADAVSRRLPEGFYQRWTSFSRVIMGAHAVTVEVELRKGGSALQTADRTPAALIPSRPRRARHLIEVARGHYLKRDHQATVGTLREAYETAPETIRYNGYARKITAELLEGPPSLRREANDLAVKVGLLG
ncbi:helix-turn-helix domain-containing protein [Phytohabitans rumicis]|uniref:Transcriptional regulator n=1 Tax=Phytohabitans rumicis TaxID=1076125 RepID=A0A6V8L428_9ACTN|nr:helix-turn-helix transcriptional regulator [Phytohabitans rumicis]GFJ90300.1 transcriptional regulator [Phytohabitans rumicis]